MGTQRQTKKREAKGEVQMEKVVDKLAGDMADRGEELVKALVLFYEKVEEPIKARIKAATNEIKAVLDEVEPGVLVLAIVNHVHDEIVMRSQQIAYKQATGIAKEQVVIDGAEENLK
jgi:Flp pilus assembly protein TadB